MYSLKAEDNPSSKSLILSVTLWIISALCCENSLIGLERISPAAEEANIPKPLTDSNIENVLGENGKVYAVYVSSYDTETTFEIILAANYLDCKSLLELMCAYVASMIKGKEPEEIRKTFNIKNDFSPEEEQKIRDENKWVEGL